MKKKNCQIGYKYSDETAAASVGSPHNENKYFLK